MHTKRTRLQHSVWACIAANLNSVHDQSEYGQSEGQSQAAGAAGALETHVAAHAQRLAETYWRLNAFKATFCGLKGEISLRPISHMKQDRIRAHLFIAASAHHGVPPLRTPLQCQRIHIRWA